MKDSAAHNLISPEAADRLILAHDADVALLYLYYVRSGSTDPEAAAAALCRTLGEIKAADEKLTRLGIKEGVSPSAGSAVSATVTPRRQDSVPPAPELSLPQYSAGELSQRSREDEDFSLILSEAEKIIGRKLSATDMKVLFGVYDYLALPTEVILVLLNHCARICYEKYGESRRPTANFIEKEAYDWAHREIFTLEQADEYIAFSKSRKEQLEIIRRNLGILDRPFSATERKDVSSWLDMGFTAEAISIAYDRTVIATGSLRWNYMRKIILNWHDNGLHSPAEIEERDGKKPRSAPAHTAAPKVKKIDDSILDKI